MKRTYYKVKFINGTSRLMYLNRNELKTLIHTEGVLGIRKLS